MSYRPLCERSCAYSAGIEVADLEDGMPCAAVKNLRSILHGIFGYSIFRPGQLDAALPALHGRDVFARMATGAGKSLVIFSVPLAHSNKAVGVIISPLISLMDEQVLKLTKLGITAIRASDSAQDFADAAKGLYRFVLMSPEVATFPPWRNLFSTPYYKQNLVLVAVDEAHTIHEWGPKFRNAFDTIGGLRALTRAPFMALTASAPHNTIEYINKSLSLEHPQLVMCSLNRPNIYLSVGKKSAVAKDLAVLGEMLNAAADPQTFPRCIIFCKRKEVVSNVFQFLRHCARKREFVAMYHASLTENTKKEIYDQFANRFSHIRCLVATIAFGMGVDICDINIVCIYGLPDTLSQLYQLIGRAGRDSSPSVAHILTDTREVKQVKDKDLAEFITSKENCRRRILIKALGSVEDLPHISLENCCDVCSPRTSGIFRRISVKRRPKPHVVRIVTGAQQEGLKKALELERDRIIGSDLGYRSLGKELVLPSGCISEICKRAQYIQSHDDILSVFGLRRELSDRLYNTFISFFSN